MTAWETLPQTTEGLKSSQESIRSSTEQLPLAEEVSCLLGENSLQRNQRMADIQIKIFLNLHEEQTSVWCKAASHLQRLCAVCNYYNLPCCHLHLLDLLYLHQMAMIPVNFYFIYLIINEFIYFFIYTLLIFFKFIYSFLFFSVNQVHTSSTLCSVIFLNFVTTYSQQTFVVT